MRQILSGLQSIALRQAWHALPVATCLLWLGGCGATDVPGARTAAAASPAPTATRATPAGAHGAASPQDRAAQEAVVLDLRQPPSPQVVDAALAARTVAAVYGDDAPADVRIVAAHAGVFTVPGRAQSAVLLVRGDGVGPAPAPPMLAVVDGDKVAAQFVPDVRYQALPGVVDADGDGLDDLLLATSGYRMGQSWEGLDVVSLAGGQMEVLQQFVQVRLDACDNPVGERSVGAAVIMRSAEGLRAERHVADCVPGGGSPPAAAFRPAPDPR